ncbi:MAG TPA: 4-hydroxyphenylacetate 3-hydroxylase N-terminal domain-containing protein, partial [Casimicrobiaceae bacterium]
MRTRDQYVESLRDGREVYYQGERVADVTTHPELSLAVRHAAIDYDMAHDPAWTSLAVEGSGANAYSSYFKLPKSSADLLHRSELIEAATTLGGTLVVLIKEIGTDALLALHLTAHATDQKKHTHYLDRVRRFYGHVKTNDL